MKRLFIVMILMIGILSTACTSSEGSAASGDIKVSGAWGRQAMSMGAMAEDGEAGGGSATGAVYLTVENTSGTPDVLLSAESDIAGTVEIHQTTLENDVMYMAPVQSLEIPAGGKVELKPGGYHVMLIGLTQDLKAGDKIHLKLTFQNAGALEIDVPIQAQ